jgi:hypothetical protein
MLIQNNNALRQCRIYRLLFLFLLAVFSISPIVDAYQDSCCSSTFDDLNDIDLPVSINNLQLNDARKPHHALKNASEQNHHYQKVASAKDSPSGLTTKPQNSANEIKSSQCCPPLSSDPSPPLL